jgi:hypothetical protein
MEGKKMQQVQTRRDWPYAIGGHITVTDRALKVDYAGKHDQIVLAQIVGVEVTMGYPGQRKLHIRHPCGVLTLPWVGKQYVKEILAAIGF